MTVRSAKVAAFLILVAASNSAAAAQMTEQFQDPAGLIWTQPQNGWILGVPAHTIVFTWQRPMLVTVAIKNVTGHERYQSNSGCFLARAADAAGHMLPAPGVIGCPVISMGPFAPGGVFVDSINLETDFRIPAPGFYDITISSSVYPGPANGHFRMRVIAASKSSLAFR